MRQHFFRDPSASGTRAPGFGQRSHDEDISDHTTTNTTCAVPVRYERRSTVRRRKSSWTAWMVEKLRATAATMTRSRSDSGTAGGTYGTRRRCLLRGLTVRLESFSVEKPSSPLRDVFIFRFIEFLHWGHQRDTAAPSTDRLCTTTDVTTVWFQ